VNKSFYINQPSACTKNEKHEQASGKLGEKDPITFADVLGKFTKMLLRNDAATTRSFCRLAFIAMTYLQGIIINNYFCEFV
jgi:hypothetical protein